MKNYHTHTVRCRHAYGQDRDYVRSAIKAGFEEIGFSDHAPMLFPENYTSSFRMLASEASDYVKSVNALKEEFKDEISIKLGYEIEYYPALFDKTEAFLAQLGYDYLVLGQHYTDNEFEPYAHYSGAKTDNVIHLNKYINQVIEGLNTGKFSYVAHPDLINFTGDSDIYEEKMTYMCNEIKRLGYPLEFNMLGFVQHRNYPNKDFWRIVGKVQNQVIIGFDAHSPDVLKNKHIYLDICRYLDRLGLQITDEIVFNE
ncbi:MAG: histidinol-phosphatase [Clostridiales bacterium]|nr:histidinol-phosphatase [Clostridiales bacterium]